MTWLKEGHVGKQKDTPKDLLGPCVNVHCMAHVWLYEMGSFFPGKSSLACFANQIYESILKTGLLGGEDFLSF